MGLGRTKSSVHNFMCLFLRYAHYLKNHTYSKAEKGTFRLRTRFIVSNRSCYEDSMVKSLDGDSSQVSLQANE